jgi:hypothetical protein
LKEIFFVEILNLKFLKINLILSIPLFLMKSMNQKMYEYFSIMLDFVLIVLDKYKSGNIARKHSNNRV